MKRWNSVLGSVAVAVAALVAGSAQAAVLFQSAVYTNIASPTINAWCSSCSGNYKVFDRFTLAGNSNLDEVDFAIQSNYGSNWNILLEIWGNDRSTNLYSHSFGAADYSLTNVGGNVNKVAVSLAGFDLDAGTYWMSWYDATNMGVPGYTDSSGVLFQAGGGDHLGQSAAFQINGTEGHSVPEPSGLALLGLAALGAGLARRRQA